jgi:hypothetical protein
VSMGGSDPASDDGITPSPRLLRVEAVFRDLAQEHMQTVAAAMIDRAHELANRPECECDVDVSVQSGLAGGPGPRDGPGSLPASGAPPEP